MKYCCKEFEINTAQADVVLGCFERQDDNTWDITVGPPKYVIIGMKFCPFCGEDLSWVDHIAKPTGDDWAVWSRGARGDCFHTKEEAEKHAILLREV